MEVLIKENKHVPEAKGKNKNKKNKTQKQTLTSERHGTNMIQYYSFIIKLGDRKTPDKTTPIHKIYIYYVYKNIYVKY